MISAITVIHTPIRTAVANGPFMYIVHKGVYVPAISKNMEQWSNLRNMALVLPVLRA